MPNFAHYHMLKNTLTFIRHRPSISIGFLCSVGSLLLGIWVAALPAIKLRLGFTDGTLGLSLLLAPVGSLTAVAVSSKIFSRVPAGTAMMIGFSLQCLAYILQVMAPSRPVFWAALFAVGFIGCLNGISSNSVIDIIEKKYQRKIMSSCHGMYSLGGGVSAGLAALFNSFHWGPGLQIILMAAAILLVIGLLRQEILSHEVIIHSGSSFAAPPATILGLAFICFATFMGEGCIADWSAIYLKETLHTSLSVASMGFAGFSVMMALGRFNGDALVVKRGPKKLVIAGSLVAGTGFLIAVGLHLPLTAITGFTLVGLGFSCIVPILFSAAANVPGVSAAMGIAAVASGGLVGFLVGPALIGLIAEKVSMPAGLSFVMLLCFVSAFIATRNSFLASDIHSSFIELT
jgi:MFS family permease